MRKIALVLFTLTLLIGAASAFTSEVHVIDSNVVVEDENDSAQFVVEIENTGTSQESYSIQVDDYYESGWYSYDNSITLDAGETGNVSLSINPANNSVAQTRGFGIIVRPRTSSEVQTHQESFRVIRSENLNVVSVEKNDSFSPGETLELEVQFKNIGSTRSQQYEVVFSALGKNKTEQLRPVAREGTRWISASFEVPRYEEPGEKAIEIFFNQRSYKESFEVQEVQDFETNSSRDNRILVIQQEVSVKNRGNIESTYNYTIKKPSYLNPVVYAPEAEREDQGSTTVYSWSETLEPGETTTIEARTDYWIPLASLFILLAGFLALKRITSTVEVKKTVKKTGEGLDITIEVENSSSRTYDDVILEDFIPNIAGLHSKFDMADPEVKQTDEGAELRWWITELQPGDQRIFRYNIKPKVEVEEGVELDPAILRDGHKVLDTSKEISTEFKPE